MSPGLLIGIPLVMAGLVLHAGKCGRGARKIAPLMGLLLFFPLLTRSELELAWTVVGMQLGLDPLARPFLLLAAIGWTLAGWYAAHQALKTSRLFWFGWLISLAAISLMLLARDLIGFYTGYAALSLSAFVLIVHRRNTEAWRAARIYLIATLAAEALILAGVLGLANSLGNTQLAELAESFTGDGTAIIAWLLLIGFAVKLGILPLHFWLPLAHPIAPLPASALLSGILVKAGLLGWLRLVPVNGIGTEGAEALLVLGLVTALGGAVLGIAQSRIKTVLAYSTVSQMGLALVGYALLLGNPNHRTEILSILSLFLLHHGLNKAALFIGCGCAPGRSRRRLLLMSLPAINLAALPLSTGFAFKLSLKSMLQGLSAPDWALTVIGLSAVATALLLLKALLLATALREPRPLHPAWPLLSLAGLVVPWAWALHSGLHLPITLADSWAATWPALLAALLIFTDRKGIARNYRWRLPEGDWVVGLESIVRWLGSRPWPELPRPKFMRHQVRTAARALDRILWTGEQSLKQLPVAGLFMLMVAATFWWLIRISNAG